MGTKELNMLTPDEIELKTFTVTLRGFDQTEVTRFLQAVAEQLQSTLAELKSTMEHAQAMQAGEVLKAANRAAAQVLADAKSEAEELTGVAAKLRDEASRIRADALALSEQEREKALQDCEEYRLTAVDEIERILKRTEAGVSSMLRVVRESRDDVLSAGQHLVARNQRRGSQRQLGS
jgi:DivIVA domain-containing protein